MTPAATLCIESLPNDRHRISITPGKDVFVDRLTWETAYPVPLIEAIYATKGVCLCDEIMREEDPRYVERSLRHEVLGYVAAADFAGKRILDFGCGAGASSMVMERLLPPCEIVGVDLQERLLKIARLRARHFSRGSVQFLQSPGPDRLPEGLGSFDYVLFSAVFEHLLPGERPALLRLVWNHLKPGGILFINQTPHRYSLFEMHTTFLPLINYLPATLAVHVARRSKHVARNATWEQLLRAGIRGGTVREILGMLREWGDPVLLDPQPEIGDRIDLWHGRLSARHAALKKCVWASLKAIKAISGAQLMPELALAIRKRA